MCVSADNLLVQVKSVMNTRTTENSRFCFYKLQKRLFYILMVDIPEYANCRRHLSIYGIITKITNYLIAQHMGGYYNGITAEHRPAVCGWRYHYPY